MTIIRYLLSYSLLFLLVALLAAAWVYRDTLAPELNAAWTRLEARLEGKAPQDATVDAGPVPGEQAETAIPEAPAEMPATPATEQAPVAAEAPRSEPPMAMQEPEPESASGSETETVMAPEPATPEPAPVVSEPEVAAATPAPETTAETEKTADVASAPAETAAAMSAVPSETSAPVAEASPATETGTPSTPQVAAAGEGEAEPAATTAPAVTPEPEASSPAVEATGPSEEAILLDRARRAYWAGDLPAAAAAYEALLDRDPAEADVWGELGNVYYAMGRWHDAGLAYYEAARRLIDRGDTRQLGYLLRIIDSLAPEKGSELRARLDAGAGS